MCLAGRLSGLLSSSTMSNPTTCITQLKTWRCNHVTHVLFLKPHLVGDAKTVEVVAVISY